MVGLLLVKFKLEKYARRYDCVTRELCDKEKSYSNFLYVTIFIGRNRPPCVFEKILWQFGSHLLYEITQF